jgi:hypothetical protein
MIEAWMVWVIGTSMFAAGCGAGLWIGLVKGQGQAKSWLDYVLATQTNNNVAQELKDKRTAAYFASRQGQESSPPRQSRRDRDRVVQMVNNDDGH